MSYSVVYTFTGAQIADAEEKLRAWRESEEAFLSFLEAYWGEGRSIGYSHADFLADAKNEKAMGTGCYYVAHALVNRPEIKTTNANGVELYQGLLECIYLEREYDEENVDPSVQRFIDFLEERGGFTGRDVDAEERAFKTELREFGFSERFANDGWLLNKLCRRSHLRTQNSDTAFPIWVVAGWENYEGYLTASELRQIDPNADDGFLQTFRRVCDYTETHPIEGVKIAESIEAIREQTLACGDDALCLVISSQ